MSSIGPSLVNEQILCRGLYTFCLLSLNTFKPMVFNTGYSLETPGCAFFLNTDVQDQLKTFESQSLGSAEDVFLKPPLSSVILQKDHCYKLSSLGAPSLYLQNLCPMKNSFFPIKSEKGLLPVNYPSRLPESIPTRNPHSSASSSARLF